MDRKSEEVYDTLFQSYPRAFGFIPFGPNWPPGRRIERVIVREIWDSIEQMTPGPALSQFEPDIRLRSDAKLFLLSNFHLMVIRPLIERDWQYPDFIGEEAALNLTSAVRDDIQFILKEAYLLAQNSRNQEVSAHMIMSVVDRLWKELRTMSFKLWAGDE